MAPKIERSIPIGELVMNYPSAVEVLFSHGFHCIGCGLSAYETLEQGALAHGFDDATIDRIVVEIKEAVKKSEGDFSSIGASKASSNTMKKTGEEEKKKEGKT